MYHVFYIWFRKRRIKVNTEKSAAMIFANKIIASDTNISLNGDNIPYITKYKYLWMYLDSKLTWARPITDILTKSTKVQGSSNLCWLLLVCQFRISYYYTNPSTDQLWPKGLLSVKHRWRNIFFFKILYCVGYVKRQHWSETTSFTDINIRQAIKSLCCTLQKSRREPPKMHRCGLPNSYFNSL